jgi:photosystem II stability/assembly factor-like uncharacterized protein
MKKIYFLLLLLPFCVSAQLEWRQLPTAPANPNNQRFDDVFFINDNVGWAANGAYAAIYKTIDGGETWTVKLSEGTPALPGNYYFRNVEFLDVNIGFVGTLNGVFLKTVNGGDTWTTVTNFPTNPLAICGLDCVGTSTIYGCGAYFTPAYMIKSVDSGVTWDYKDMSAYANALVEILFVDENIGYAAGNDDSGGVILKTIDGGQTWNSIYNSNVPGEYVWKLQILFSDPNVILGSVEGVAPMPGKFIKSVDNGVNWVTKNAPETIIQGMGFITENHGWMGGHTTGFYETVDGGDTWTNTGVGNNLNRIFIINDHLGYGSGTSIYKFSEGPLSVKVPESPRTPLKASVQPNPVKDKLNIRIEFTESDHLNLDLYDAVGHRIKELQKDNISAASTKNYSFDFPYAAGVYFVDIHTNTGRQSIKFVK